MNSVDPPIRSMLKRDPATPHRSPVPARAYVAPEILAREQERIFRSLWIFVGVKQLLRDDNAFLTRSIGGMSVVIQNTGGRIRAFENRCLHRQMAIQTETVGCRPMVCKYHGWAYDADGRVRGIPNAQLYEFPVEIRDGLCLREFALKEVGNLLFVCIDPDPPKFIMQFSPDFVETLEASSATFDWEVAYVTFDVRYNWKLNYENVLDWNHVQFIHSNTFYPLLNVATGEPEPIAVSPNLRKVQRELDSGAPVSLQDLSYATHGPMIVAPTPWGKDVGRYGDLDDYYNWFVYPNVNYCSVHGKMFLIQQYMPKTPGVTEYHLWVMTGKRVNDRAEFAGLLWSLIRAEKAVIDEDAVVLEQLQAKLAGNATTCMNGAYEAHIVRMHRWYAERIGLDPRG